MRARMFPRQRPLQGEIFRRESRQRGIRIVTVAHGLTDEVLLDEVTIVIIRIVKRTDNAIQRHDRRNEGNGGKKPTGGRGKIQRALRRVAQTTDASASISNWAPF